MTEINPQPIESLGDGDESAIQPTDICSDLAGDEKIRPSVGSLAEIMGAERARLYIESEVRRRQALICATRRRRGEDDHFMRRYR
ncbi:MAG TPA: hypothetical protein VMQ52_03355 [Candidatus Saccharimonadales bacterium]|jgi:hypothetical protein|nr:hypothetical protein [Candidatus Saccharimonadales bacterium]